jgi:hypothetical protein
MRATGESEVIGGVFYFYFYFLPFLYSNHYEQTADDSFNGMAPPGEGRRTGWTRRRPFWSLAIPLVL